MLPTLRQSGRNSWSDPLTVAHDNFDRLLSRLFYDAHQDTGFTYPVDIREDDKNLYVEAELPGFKKDEVEITCEKGVLSIRAERQPIEMNGEVQIQERRIFKYARSFTMPSIVDDSRITADLEDGVLRLTLPKQENARPRQIKLK